MKKLMTLFFCFLICFTTIQADQIVNYKTQNEVEQEAVVQLENDQKTVFPIKVLLGSMTVSMFLGVLVGYLLRKYKNSKSIKTDKNEDSELIKNNTFEEIFFDAVILQKPEAQQKLNEMGSEDLLNLEFANSKDNSVTKRFLDKNLVDFLYYFCDGNELCAAVQEYSQKNGINNSDELIQEYIDEYRSFLQSYSQVQDYYNIEKCNDMVSSHSCKLLFCLYYAKQNNLLSLQTIFTICLRFAKESDRRHQMKDLDVLFWLNVLFFSDGQDHSAFFIQMLETTLLLSGVEPPVFNSNGYRVKYKRGNVLQIQYQLIAYLYDKMNESNFLHFMNTHRSLLFSHIIKRKHLDMIKEYQNNKNLNLSDDLPEEIQDFIQKLDNDKNFQILEYEKYRATFFCKQYIKILFTFTSLSLMDQVELNEKEKLFIAFYTHDYLKILNGKISGVNEKIENLENSYSKGAGKIPILQQKLKHITLEKQYTLKLQNMFANKELLDLLKSDKNISFKKDSIYFYLQNCASSKFYYYASDPCPYTGFTIPLFAEQQCNLAEKFENLIAERKAKSDFFPVKDSSLKLVDYYYNLLHGEADLEVDLYTKNNSDVEQLVFQLHQYEIQHHQAVIKKIYNEIIHGSSFADVYCSNDDCEICPRVQYMVRSYESRNNNQFDLSDLENFFSDSRKKHSEDSRLVHILNFINTHTVGSIFEKWIDVEGDIISLHDYFYNFIDLNDTNPFKDALDNKEEIEEKLRDVYNKSEKKHIYYQNLNSEQKDLHRFCLTPYEKIVCLPQSQIQFPDNFRWRYNHESLYTYHIESVPKEEKKFFEENLEFLCMYREKYQGEFLQELKNNCIITLDEKNNISQKEYKQKLQKQFELRKCLTEFAKKRAWGGFEPRAAYYSYDVELLSKALFEIEKELVC